jgi:hypothetical protein
MIEFYQLMEGIIMKKFFLILIVLLTSEITLAGWILKRANDQIIEVKWITKEVTQKDLLTDLPEFLDEGVQPSSSRFHTQLIPDESLPENFESYLKTKAQWPNSEVATLVHQGPPENRIDLTIVGDGYTISEKQRFFEDAQRITDDLFKESTFKSYLPLFNVHAVFVPSKESGLTDKTQVDTALGLYRGPAGSKRGIYPGNTTAIDRALSLAPDTDYPILMANDEFYGGLGGRYAITTRSRTTGSMVLRHELGHNFGSVGEEYDGGSAYFGANFSATSDARWKYWNPENFQVFESKILTGDYVWQDLKTKPYQASFTFPEGDFNLKGQVSTVGWKTADDVHVKLNGEIVPLDGLFTEDRSFFYFSNEDFKKGQHKIEAVENISDGDNNLAFIRMWAEPRTMIKERGFVGAYSVFNDNKTRVGFRPTYDTCLMRDMSSKEFCSVDKENMWKRFLAVVDLVDNLLIEETKEAHLITVESPNLGDLQYSWFRKTKDGDILLNETSNKLKVLKGHEGEFSVRVNFNTREVLRPSNDFSVLRTITIN